MSLQRYRKTLGRIEHSKTTVDRNRHAFYDFYFNYFYNIIVNYFTWYNLPDGIDEIFIEQKLIENGHISFFEDEELGYLLQSGTRGERLNIYDQPTTYIPVNASNVKFDRMVIAYSRVDFEFINEEHNNNKRLKPCIVIPNNNFYEPYLQFFTK